MSLNCDLKTVKIELEVLQQLVNQARCQIEVSVHILWHGLNPKISLGLDTNISFDFCLLQKIDSTLNFAIKQPHHMDDCRKQVCIS